MKLHEAEVTVVDCSPHQIPQGSVTKPSFTVQPFLLLWHRPQPFCCLLSPALLWDVEQAAEAWAFRGRNSPCSHIGRPALTPGSSGQAFPGVWGKMIHDFIKSLPPALTGVSQWLEHQPGH